MKKRYLISKVALAMGAALALMASSAQAIVIDNGIPIGTVGHWSVDVLTGGAVTDVMFTTQRYDSTEVVTEDFVNQYHAFVDPGIDGGGFRLNGSDPVRDSIDPNMVRSSGTFVGVNNNTISWSAKSRIAPGSQSLRTTYMFEVLNPGIPIIPIGPLRVLQYLDADIQPSAVDDVLRLVSTAGPLMTHDNIELFGVGLIEGGTVNATFVGGAADRFNGIQPRIVGNGQPVSTTITPNLPSFEHPELGLVYGPRDIVSVIAWDINPSSSAGIVNTFLLGIAPPPSPESVDTDLDGVPDSIDSCPGTIPGTPVRANGCPSDLDGDGVPDSIDSCPGTIPGTPVRANGCPSDLDGDGVPDSIDSCPGTIPGTPVRANGCPIPPSDLDGDGVPDSIDSCPGTIPGTPVRANGCPIPPSDSDGDGVPDSIDNCPTISNPNQSDIGGDGLGDACTPPPTSTPLSQNPQIGCTGGAACGIRIQCNGSTGTVCDISVRIFVAKKRRLALRNDPTKARRQLFALGATNFPAGQIKKVKLGVRKAGKLIARTSKRRKIKGIMEIYNATGAFTSIPVRIRLR